MSIGRNDPCPCGSGQKYKKCHLAADSAPRDAARTDTRSSLHELDNRIVRDIVELAARRFPDELRELAEILDSHPSMDAQLARHWLAWIALFDDRTAVEWYLEHAGWSLSRGAAEWIAAQRQAWLSIWQVLEVERGHKLILRDLLSGEERVVHEVQGSRVLEANLLVLCRIVDYGGVSTMCGVHPQPFEPAHGLQVIDRMRKVLRRKTAVPPERLREGRIAWRMLEEWSTVIDALSGPPELVNGDGDPILLTSDRWKIAAGARKAIVAAVRAMEGATEEEPGEFALVRESDMTLLGYVRVSGTTVVVETNSIARADLLRERMEASCAGLLGARVRSHSDPTSVFGEELSGSSPADAATSEENALIREMKERHYADWLDKALPALGGKSPRETARTASGRERVKLLLQGIEDLERTSDEGARFDVSRLWRELGLK